MLTMFFIYLSLTESRKSSHTDAAREKLDSKSLFLKLSGPWLMSEAGHVTLMELFHLLQVQVEDQQSRILDKDPEPNVDIAVL